MKKKQVIRDNNENIHDACLLVSPHKQYSGSIKLLTYATESDSSLLPYIILIYSIKFLVLTLY